MQHVPYRTVPYAYVRARDCVLLVEQEPAKLRSLLEHRGKVVERANTGQNPVVEHCANSQVMER